MSFPPDANAKNYRKKRDRVMRLLGGRCEWCGLDYAPLLSIDHIEGDGNIHRRVVKGGTHGVLNDILNMRYPLEKVRLLCHNCQMLSVLQSKGKCTGVVLETWIKCLLPGRS